MVYKASIAIVSVPSRYPYAKHLLQMLGSDRDHATIKVDTALKGSWYGHKIALEAFGKDCTHHVVLEEDVIPCADFLSTILEIVSVVPDRHISLYSSRADKTKNEWAKRNGLHWFRCLTGSSGQGWIMPVEMIVDFLSWEKRNCPQDMPYEDSRLWGYNFTHNLESWYVTPQIVEHIAPMNSSLGFNNKGKVAYEFIGANVSGLSIDWTKIDKNCKSFSYTIGKGTYEQYCGQTDRNPSTS